VSFAPVYNEHSRALILGTWPSPRSREMSFYYGHPQNRFWPMLAALTGEPVPAREDIEAKKQIILRHGLALWDTLESCTITGASDASIRDVVPNDIAGLLAKAPIEAVFCNGSRCLLGFHAIQPLLMPPTNAGFFPAQSNPLKWSKVHWQKPMAQPVTNQVIYVITPTHLLHVYWMPHRHEQDYFRYQSTRQFADF
jgi:hypoxanthine-DNA glycosylase